MISVLASVALGGFPDRFWNSTRLVKDHEDSPALIVQAGEGFRIVLTPRHHIYTPRFHVVRISREDTGGFKSEE
jgi:hypothetical protein